MVQLEIDIEPPLLSRPPPLAAADRAFTLVTGAPSLG